MSKSLSDGFRQGFHTKFANVLLYFPRERERQPRNIGIRSSNVFGNLNSNFKATKKTNTTFFFPGGGSAIERYREECNAYYNFLGMSAAGKKRKLGDGDEEKGKKWYAVKAGHTPGVYESYKECQRMTTGFKGANCTSLSIMYAKSLFANSGSQIIHFEERRRRLLRRQIRSYQTGPGQTDPVLWCCGWAQPRCVYQLG